VPGGGSTTVLARLFADDSGVAKLPRTAPSAAARSPVAPARPPGHHRDLCAGVARHTQMYRPYRPRIRLDLPHQGDAGGPITAVHLVADCRPPIAGRDDLDNQGGRQFQVPALYVRRREPLRPNHGLVWPQHRVRVTARNCLRPSGETDVWINRYCAMDGAIAMTADYELIWACTSEPNPLAPLRT
jgi:hypothetical protein